MEFNEIPFYINDALSQTKRMMSTLASDKGLKLQFYTDTDIKHKVLGEVICAFVITKKNQPFEEEKIKRYCSKLLADYQMPFYYKVVKKFPRGSLNKISKYKLKLDYKNLNNI